MRLPEFVVHHVDRIVDEWEDFARSLKPAADSMSSEDLRDHAKSILLAAARDMGSAQSKGEQMAKARGESRNASLSLDQAAACHGELRHEVGFDLVQMTSEFRHLRASVIRLWVESLSAPRLDDFQDVVRFNEAIDEALAESTAAYADRVNRSRDMFLAILGHDLRAPLQAIGMSAELLGGKVELNEKALHYIAQIKNSTRHMGTMVADLLEFVKTRLGSGLPVDRKRMDLAAACRDALEEACAGVPDTAPVLEVEGDAHGCWDNARIGQLLQNLIGNAMQHGAASEAITVRVIGSADTVQLSVHNGGLPIAEDAIGTIFDPLVRSIRENTDARDPSTSLGLGLFIVKEVVNAHGGSVTVNSSADDGTTFSVVLPRV